MIVLFSGTISCCLTVIGQANLDEPEDYASDCGVDPCGKCEDNHRRDQDTEHAGVSGGQHEVEVVLEDGFDSGVYGFGTPFRSAAS